MSEETRTTDDLPVEVEPEDQPIDPRDLGLELPADHDDAIQLLLQELVTARREADSYLADLQRLAAEFDNYRRRTLREQAQNIERASERITRNLLPVLDSLDAALETEPSTPAEENLVAGVRGTRDLLLDILKGEGLEVIPTVGVPFNPEVHEAAIAPEPGDGTLVVTQELRRGYSLHGKVIRAALVAVDHE